MADSLERPHLQAVETDAHSEYLLSAKMPASRLTAALTAFLFFSAYQRGLRLSGTDRGRLKGDTAPSLGS
jgi:hypothetical protein